jgi:branched-chain amino acid transport system ATP-binding protein
MLLVEQRATEALELCDYGYVLESGHVAAEGTRNQLLNDGRVKRAYLGM